MDSNLENDINFDENNDSLTQPSEEQDSHISDEHTNDNDNSSDEDISSLKSKLLQQELISKDFLDKYQRTLADFDNFRKRTIAEKASMFDNGAMSSIEKLLPVLDNFQRAIDSISDDDKLSPIFTGVSMIYSQMQEAFSSMGLLEIDGVGSTFDPSIHNAVLHVEDPNFEQNVVIEVLQKGYKFKDKVLRPSMVKVAN